MQLHNRFVQLKKRTCTSPGSMQLSESNVLSAPLTYNSIHRPGANDRISTLAEAQKSPDSKPEQDPEVSALLHFILPAFSFFLWTFPIWAPKYWGKKILKMQVLWSSLLRGLGSTTFLCINFVFSGLEKAALLVQPQESS